MTGIPERDGALGLKLVARMDDLTWQRHGALALENAERNAQFLDRGKSLADLRDAPIGAGDSAIVIAAGPSIKRRDPLTQVLVQIACAVYWFNPVVWFAAWRIRVERERACDDLVVNSGIKAEDYAEHLLRIVSGFEGRGLAGVSGLTMARKGRLEGRLCTLLNNKTNRSALTRSALVTTAAVILTLSIPLAMLRAVEQQKDAAREKEPANITGDKDPSRETAQRIDRDGGPNKGPADAEPIIVFSHQNGIKRGGETRTDLTVLPDGTVIATSDHRNRECRIKLSKMELAGLLRSIDKDCGFFDIAKDGIYFFAPGDKLDLWDRSYNWIHVRSGGRTHKIACGYGWTHHYARFDKSAIRFKATYAKLSSLSQLVRAGGPTEVARCVTPANRGLKQAFPGLPALTAADFKFAEFFPFGSRRVTYLRDDDRGRVRVSVELPEKGTPQALRVTFNDQTKDVEKPPIIRGLDLADFPVKYWTQSDVTEKRALRPGERGSPYKLREGFESWDTTVGSLYIWVHRDRNVFYVEHYDRIRKKSTAL
ncbi:MAG: M56 family metallopeptidase [Planctomycetes bacterium]|nr:M56 family metallopeptidase [Planctomycetota bacterium]